MKNKKILIKLKKEEWLKKVFGTIFSKRKKESLQVQVRR
jgi:hypothetical protein